MSDKDHKPGADPWDESPENSNEEMEILKEAFAKPETAREDLFSTDLFGAPAETSASEAATSTADPAASHEENIKVVTDDDVSDLFDMSAPGSPPPQAGQRMPQPEEDAGDSVAEISAPPAILELGKEPEPEPLTRPADVKPVAAEVEEIGFDEKQAAPAREPAPQTILPTQQEAPPPKSAESRSCPQAEEAAEIGLDDHTEPEPPAPGPPPEKTPATSEDIIDNLEFKASVGDIKAVAAGKKGDLLKQTEKVIEALEPMSGDFMSMEEMEKLFRNVNTLIKMVENLTERLEKIEAAVKKD